MNTNQPRTDQTLMEARSALAVAHRGGAPDAQTEHLLRANLGFGNLDQMIRKLPDGLLYPVHVESLVELLLMKAGVDGATVRLVGSTARSAVEAAARKEA